MADAVRTPGFPRNPSGSLVEVRTGQLSPWGASGPTTRPTGCSTASGTPSGRANAPSLIYEFPSNQELWARYAGMHRGGLACGEGIAAATAFYRKHRAAMDRGAVVAWEALHKPEELSAVQHAMNLKILAEHAFWSEFQNRPLREDAESAGPLTAEEIAGKVNGMDRGLVPAWCKHLTAFIDVHDKMLFYLVAGWSADFSGAVVDYGTEPDQKDPLFTMRASRRTLRARHKGASPGVEALLYAGLESLVGRLCGGEWARDDGTPMRLDRCLIDANWAASTDTVRSFCRQSPLGALLYPSHGRYVGAFGKPFSEYKPKRGDRLGTNWRIPTARGKRAVRHVAFDTNFWKSFVHERLGVGMGDPGCLSLFGRDAREHRLFAEHLTAEYPVRTEGRGRTVDEWRVRKPGLDNHWLDCAVGAALAASIQGAALFGAREPGRRERRRITMSDLQRRS